MWTWFHHGLIDFLSYYLNKNAITMVTWHDSPFELQETENEFREICEKLKNHPFDSLWKAHFVDDSTQEKTTFKNDIFEISISDFNEDEPMDTSNYGIKRQHVESSPINPVCKSKIQISEEKIFQLKQSMKYADVIENIKSLDIFYEISSCQVPVVCEMIDVPSLSESSIALLLSAIQSFKKPISVATAAALIHHAVYPKMGNLQDIKSRSLLTSVLNFTETYPKVVIDEIIIPSLKSVSLELSHLEMFSKIAKTHLPNEYVSYCIRSLLELDTPAENLFTLIQCLIERKATYDQVTYEELTWKLENWAVEHNNNLKFTKLIISLLSVYGSQLTGKQLSVIKDIVKNNTTIIKKAAENLLKKLQIV